MFALNPDAFYLTYAPPSRCGKELTVGGANIRLNALHGGAGLIAIFHAWRRGDPGAANFARAPHVILAQAGSEPSTRKSYWK
jgi:hypothetical protein